MKKSEIKVCLEALKKITIPKIEDKAIRNDIISDHIALLGEQKKLEAAIKDLETAHLGAYEEERSKVGELQQKMQAEKDAEKKKALADEINSHEELFHAIVGYNKAVESLLGDEVKVPYPLESRAFVEAMEGQDYDLGLIEAVYPLFKV